MEIKDGRRPGFDVIGRAAWNWWFYTLTGGLIFVVLPMFFKEETWRVVRGARDGYRAWRDKERDTSRWGKVGSGLWRFICCDYDFTVNAQYL